MALRSMWERLDVLKADCATAVAEDATNQVRRKLYSLVGLLELDVEESGKLAVDEQNALLKECRALSTSLPLRTIKAKKGVLWTLLGLVDEYARIVSTWTFLLNSSVLVAPPSVLLDLIYPAGEFARRGMNFIGKTSVVLSGVELIVEGVQPDTFGTKVSVLAFTHASTMDAFILAAAAPCSLYTLSKKELFIIPFFGWILACYGGVAINRSDRNQAIDALQSAEERSMASASKAAVSISPEGTRSKTGQLLPFKKGAFYLWEQLNAPVVPMMVYGAYDLYGPGKNMSAPGRVVCRLLPPIQPSEVDPSADDAQRRELMSRTLRRRMLQAGLESPAGVGDEGGRTYGDRLGNAAALALLWSFNYLAGTAAMNYLDKHGWSNMQIAGWGVGSTMGVSVCCYIYKLYFAARPSKSKAKGQ